MNGRPRSERLSERGPVRLGGAVEGLLPGCQDLGCLPDPSTAHLYESEHPALGRLDRGTGRSPVDPAQRRPCGHRAQLVLGQRQAILEQI